LAGAPAATAQVVSQTSLGRTLPDARWVVDMVHSQVDFGVRHLVGRVRGAFDKMPLYQSVDVICDAKSGHLKPSATKP
jgi:hypothetical protein